MKLLLNGEYKIDLDGNIIEFEKIQKHDNIVIGYVDEDNIYKLKLADNVIVGAEDGIIEEIE